MSILKRIARLSAVVVTLALGPGLATSVARASEICVIGGDIHYCAPKDV